MDPCEQGELFERRVEAARRLARQLVTGPDGDDPVSEAFAKVLAVLQHGGGPDQAFRAYALRAYLLAAVRRLHVDRLRAGVRLRSTGDLTPFDPGVPFRDPAVEGLENNAATRAFASLPERWQLVLWHTEAEGQRPAEVAPLPGPTPNGVSALAYRAREGVRQAYLSTHTHHQTHDQADCAWTHDHLGAYVRGGLPRRDAARVEEHLGGCRRCAAVWLELDDLNRGLAGLLAPLLLGAAAEGYVGSGTAGVSAAAGSAWPWPAGCGAGVDPRVRHRRLRDGTRSRRRQRRAALTPLLARRRARSGFAAEVRVDGLPPGGSTRLGVAAETGLLGDHPARRRIVVGSSG